MYALCQYLQCFRDAKLVIQIPTGRRLRQYLNHSTIKKKRILNRMLQFGPTLDPLLS